MLSLTLALALTSQCPGGVCPPQSRYLPPTQAVTVYQPSMTVTAYAAPCRPVRRGLFGGLFRRCR